MAAIHKLFALAIAAIAFHAQAQSVDPMPRVKPEDAGFSSERLARIVERAADGEPIIPGQLLGPLLELIREMPDGGWRPLHSRLTTREWEIIELLEQGANTHQIADQLVLSATTIYSHVKSVLRKLGVHNRHDAIIAANQLRKHETHHPTHPHTPTRCATTTRPATPTSPRAAAPKTVLAALAEPQPCPTAVAASTALAGRSPH